MRQMNNTGEGEKEEEYRFTYESMIRAEAHDTITVLDCNSLSPSGSVGGSYRHGIYQDGKYPATYRNILLQQKDKGRCSSMTSQARPGTPLRLTISSNSGPSVQEGIEDPTSHAENRPQGSRTSMIPTSPPNRQRISFISISPSNSAPFLRAVQRVCPCHNPAPTPKQPVRHPELS